MLLENVATIENAMKFWRMSILTVKKKQQFKL